jgi:hypothetical protein
MERDQPAKLPRSFWILLAIFLYLAWLANSRDWPDAVASPGDPCTVVREGACLTRSESPAVQQGVIEGWECTEGIRPAEMCLPSR